MHRRMFAVFLAAAVMYGCSEKSPQEPTGSPIAGLGRIADNDTTSGSPTTAPGYFRGTVLGPAIPGSGPDSMSTAPRIAGVRVAAYVRTDDGSGDVTVGAEVATALTDSNGEFTLPEMPPGPYVVTFTVPSTSAYRGVWATSYIHAGSADYPWWVVLPLK
jgi:hypothetical protein